MGAFERFNMTLHAVCCRRAAVRESLGPNCAHACTAGGASAAQEAARAAFAAEKAEGFYSSDDEESQSSTSFSATASNAGGLKLKVRKCTSLPRHA